MFGYEKSRQLLRAGCLIVCMSVVSGRAYPADRPDISEHLKSGQLATAQEMLTKHLSVQPQDDLARFQLGTTQFLHSVEQLAQDGARYGVLARGMSLPFFRVAGTAIRDAEPVTYDDVRAVIQRFVSSLEEAEATLAAVKDPGLHWEIDLQAMRLDLNGDGQVDDKETLWSLFRVANPTQPPAGDKGFFVGLDSADVYWLRAYIHAISALGETILAYDERPLFDRTAHVFFAKPQTEFAALLPAAAPHEPAPFDREVISDLIAAVHSISFQPLEPDRLTRAQDHWLQMIRLSRQSWELIDGETDNDHEWIPGPEQTSVIQGLAMSRERIETWRTFLKEAEAILRGEKLVPYWRSGVEQGVNLDRVFREPRAFDLVLWIQGTAAMPYLEAGEKSDSATWQEFQRVFRGEFVGFAFWIN